MEPISSRRNQRLARVRRLLAERRARTREGLLAVEGEDLVAAALAAGDRARRRARRGGCAARRRAGRGRRARPGAGRAGPAGRGRHARSRGAHRRRRAPGRPAAGAAGPARASRWRWSAWPIRATSARCCAGWRCSGPGVVAVGPGSADPLGPRVVRASMGAIFHVPLLRTRRARPRLSRHAHGRARRVGRRAPRRHRPHGAGHVPRRRGAARPAGGHGGAGRRAARTSRSAPRAGIDSLNAGMAGTIALYERRRQLVSRTR